MQFPSSKSHAWDKSIILFFRFLLQQMRRRITQHYSNTQITKYFGEDSDVIIYDGIRTNALLELILTSQ